jgi:hypothetical protein
MHLLEIASESNIRGRFGSTRRFACEHNSSLSCYSTIGSNMGRLPFNLLPRESRSQEVLCFETTRSEPPGELCKTVGEDTATN